MSVSKGLFRKGGNTHAPLSAIQQVFPQVEFEAYFKFTFIRNPWDRLVSAYEFLRTGVSPSEYDWEMSEKLQSLGDFRSFVYWVRDTNAGEGMHLLPQYHYVRTKDDEMGMDFIGRFESFSRDFSKVAERLGIDARLPHLNAAPSRYGYQQYFDSELVDIVGEVYRRDIELFGYDFDNAERGAWQNRSSGKERSLWGMVKGG